MNFKVPIQDLLRITAQAEKAEKFPGQAQTVVVEGDDIFDSSTYAWELMIWVDAETQTITAFSQGDVAGGVVTCQCTEATESFGFQLLAESKRTLLMPLSAMGDRWVDVSIKYDASQRALGVSSAHHGSSYTVSNVLPCQKRPESIFVADANAKTLTTQGNLLAIAADHCAAMLFNGVVQVGDEKRSDPEILRGVDIYSDNDGVFMAGGSQLRKRFVTYKLDVSQLSSSFEVNLRHQVLKAITSAMQAMVPTKEDLENVEVTISLNADNRYQVEATFVEDGIPKFSIAYSHYSLPNYPRQLKQRFVGKKADFSFHCSSLTAFRQSFAGMVAFSAGAGMEVPFVALSLDKELKAVCPGMGAPYRFAVGGMAAKPFELSLKIENLHLVIEAIASHCSSDKASFTLERYGDSIVITPKMGGATGSGNTKFYPMGHQYVLRPIEVDESSRQMKAVRAAFKAPSPTRQLATKPQAKKSVAVEVPAATDSREKKSVPSGSLPKSDNPKPAASKRSTAKTSSKSKSTAATK